MKKWTLGLMCLAISGSCLALSPGDDGNALLASLNDREVHGLPGLGKGYVVGVFDTLYAHEEVCIGTHVSNEQIIDVVKRFAMVHPESLHYRANALTEFALKESYPCNKKGTK